MAGLIKIHKSYYARVRMPPGSTPGEIRIPLKTGDELTARTRRLEVEKRELDLKAGMDYRFPWEDTRGRTSARTLSIGKAITIYLRGRGKEGIRSSTLDIYESALLHFSKAIGSDFPISRVSIKQIDKYRAKAKRVLKPTTINIRLRAIKTFLYWLQERDYIQNVPKIKLMKIDDSGPIYVSNQEFHRICEQVPDYLKRVFNFYRGTGCRLREPFYGEVNGRFLTILAESAKGKRSRDIPLTTEQLNTLQEMRDKTHLFEVVSDSRNAIRHTHYIKYYSHEFRKACIRAMVGGKKFHSLRHTFAVREYLKTRDIYHVASMMGHASVVTTEVYARFNLKRLEQDFPDLVKPSVWMAESA